MYTLVITQTHQREGTPLIVAEFSIVDFYVIYAFTTLLIVIQIFRGCMYRNYEMWCHVIVKHVSLHDGGQSARRCHRSLIAIFFSLIYLVFWAITPFDPTTEHIWMNSIAFFFVLLSIPCIFHKNFRPEIIRLIFDRADVWFLAICPFVNALMHLSYERNFLKIVNVIAIWTAIWCYIALDCLIVRPVSLQFSASLIAMIVSVINFTWAIDTLEFRNEEIVLSFTVGRIIRTLYGAFFIFGVRSFGIALLNMIHGKKVLLFVRARGMRPLLTQTILEDPDSADSADDSTTERPSVHLDTSGTTNFIPPSVSRNRISIRSIRNSRFWSQASSIFDLRISDHTKLASVAFEDLNVGTDMSSDSYTFNVMYGGIERSLNAPFTSQLSLTPMRVASVTPGIPARSSIARNVKLIPVGSSGELRNIYAVGRE